VARYFETFGNFLREARLAAELSQAAVAQAFRFDQQLISNWERGLSAPPVRTLKKFAKLYGISVEDLYERLMEDSLRRTRLRLEAEIRRVAK
jgi:transcriptional regulator with XRE-family HTH domain